MTPVILKFAACCRAADMRISTAEVLDCLIQLDRVDFSNKALFTTVLRANFAKSRREQAQFDRLFHLFFHEMQAGVSPDPDVAKGPARGEDTGEQAGLADLVQLLREADAPEGILPLQASEADQALMNFLAGNPLAFIQQVQKIHNQEATPGRAFKSNLGQVSLRLEIMLSIHRVKARMVQFLGSHDAWVGKEVQVLKEALNRRLDRASGFLTTEPLVLNAGLRQSGPGEIHHLSLGEIPFSNLTQSETDQVKQVIDRLVRKLEEISSRRLSAARRGMVDVKKTIQRSARYLGVPVEIVKRDRPLRKGKIVVLCDVSGSVWSAARFMLNILYSLQTSFSRVKSYVFIEKPVEVTHFFIAHPANEAIQLILNDPRVNYHARTDYGLAFQGFRDHHLHELDQKTTLILMGDARSNYLNPREPVLEILRERCRRLIWLNPEQERFWGTGDSEMIRYRDHCNEARACGNLNQLMDFIESLVL